MRAGAFSSSHYHLHVHALKYAYIHLQGTRAHVTRLIIERVKCNPNISAGSGGGQMSDGAF